MPKKKGVISLKRKILLYLLNFIRGWKENGNDSDGKNIRPACLNTVWSAAVPLAATQYGTAAPPCRRKTGGTVTSPMHCVRKTLIF